MIISAKVFYNDEQYRDDLGMETVGSWLFIFEEKVYELEQDYLEESELSRIYK